MAWSGPPAQRLTRSTIATISRARICGLGTGVDDPTDQSAVGIGVGFGPRTEPTLANLSDDGIEGRLAFCRHSPRYTLLGMYIMEGMMQVAKWGNSLAVRLPAAVIEALGLKEGDDIEIMVAGSRTFEVSKKPEVAEVLTRLRKYRGRLPDGFKFDRLEAHER
jgi:antitoxin MazE